MTKNILMKSRAKEQRKLYHQLLRKTSSLSLALYWVNFARACILEHCIWTRVQKLKVLNFVTSTEDLTTMMIKTLFLFFLLQTHQSELFNISVATDKHGTLPVTCPVTIGFAAPTWKDHVHNKQMITCSGTCKYSCTTCVFVPLKNMLTCLMTYVSEFSPSVFSLPTVPCCLLLLYKMHDYGKTDGQVAKCLYTVVGNWQFIVLHSIHQWEEGILQLSHCWY